MSSAQSAAEAQALGISPQLLEQIKQRGAPYPPTSAGLGGRPTVAVDVPICAVLIALFITTAAFNMTILQLNNRRGHKFLLSGLLFGFSMARITANVLRIVWANRPDSTSIAIAASVLTNAGVVLLFVVNLILVQRIVRAHHPTFGWSRPVRLVFRALYTSVAAAIILVIIAVVYSFFTLDVDARRRTRDAQLTGTVFLAFLAFLPIPIGLAATLIPSREEQDPFGQSHAQGRARSLRFKLALILFTATLLTLGAAFRAGIAFYVRPASNPAWFHSKACYYCFIYTIELICVFTYALSRFDRLYHIPNGSSSAGDYSRPVDEEKPSIDDGLDTERPPTAAETQQEEAAKWDSQLRHELNSQAV